MSNVADNPSSSDDYSQHPNHHQHHRTKQQQRNGALTHQHQSQPIVADDLQLIKLFWTNFSSCNGDRNKVEWLDLFIVHFKCLISNGTTTLEDLRSDRYRFMATAASQLTCYLLQLVHEIVCASLAYSGSNIDTTVVGSAASTANGETPPADQAAPHGSDIETKMPAVAGRTSSSQQRRVRPQHASAPDRYSTEMAVLDSANITTIGALREFLTHGVGGRILEVLMLIDTNNMLCARELTRLLINLFPTGPWQGSDRSSAATTECMDDFESMQSALVRLEAVTRQRTHRKMWRRTAHNQNSGASRAHNFSTIESAELNYGIDSDARAAIDTDRWCEFVRPVEFNQLTVDHIGSLVLNLLNKLVAEDTIASLQTTAATNTGRDSVTLQCLHFAVDTYATMADSLAFTPSNNAILARRLMTIICRALSSVFGGCAAAVSRDTDVVAILGSVLVAASRLFDLDGMRPDKVVGEHQLAVCMMLALVLKRGAQRIDGHLDARSVESTIHDRNKQMADVGNPDVILIDRLTDVLDQHTAFVVRLLLHVERIDAVDGNDFAKCIGVLQQLIQSMRSASAAVQCEMQLSSHHQSSSMSASNRRRGRIQATRKRSQLSALNACGVRQCDAQLYLHHNHQHHHRQQLHRGHDDNRSSSVDHSHSVMTAKTSLPCILEHILLSLSERVTSPVHSRLIYRHFQRSGGASASGCQCCCNIRSIAGLQQMLLNARLTSTLSFGLQYLRKQILRPTFGQRPAHHSTAGGGAAAGTPGDTVTCDACEKRRVAFTMDGVFVGLYRDLAATCLSAELPTLLRHLGKVAKYLPFDTACRIMAEVLLPQFRQHKANVGSNANDGGGDVIVTLCLNAFLCYLRDIRLIKGFYNDDNIQHLADLMAHPQLASLVCCLVRIGADNASFLGENCGEQAALADRLRRLQSDSVQSVTDALAALFRALNDASIELGEGTLGGGGIGLASMDGACDGDDCTSERVARIEDNVLMARLEARELSVPDLLRLAIVYWNNMLQMLRRTTATSITANCASDTATTPSRLVSDELVAAMVHNTLTCFLYRRPIRKESCPTEFDGVGKLAGRFVWVPHDHDDDHGMEDVVDACVQRNTAIYAVMNNEAEVVDEVDSCRRFEEPVNKSGGIGSCGGSSLYLNVGNVSTCTSTELIYDLRRSEQEQQKIDPITDASKIGLYSSSSMFSERSITGSRFASSVDLSLPTIFGANTHSNNANVTANGGGSNMADSASVSVASGGNVVHNVFQYISDNVWDMLFSTNNTDQTHAAAKLARDQHLARVFGSIDERMRVLEELDNRRLFLQLFELACGVLVCDGGAQPRSTTTADRNAPAETMANNTGDEQPNKGVTRSRALLQLKAILLRHSEHPQHDTNATNGGVGDGTNIVEALQSLLKCAEMRYRCCTLDECDHASYAQACPAAAVTMRRSTDVGDTNMMCCSATTTTSLAATTVPATTVSTNSFDGICGGGGGIDAGAKTDFVDDCKRDDEDGIDARKVDNYGRSLDGSAAPFRPHDSFSSDADRTDDDEPHIEVAVGDADDEELDRMRRMVPAGSRLSSDGSYVTADEGYDGDAELAASLDSDNDGTAADTGGGHHQYTGNATTNNSIVGDHDDTIVAQLPAVSQPPASRYRQHVVHADICRIVVDMLVELSKRCLVEPDFWPKYLLSITQRLTAIRDSLGGSLYLLRGFGPVLESNDPRLRDFQKAILGLLTDVCSPETLTAYFAVMANGERPPMDLLLSRLFALGGASHRMQPVAELRFPTATDGTLKSAAHDRSYCHAAIAAMRQTHCSHSLRTALTRATYMIPIDASDFRPWSTTSSGFTVATWINIRPNGRVSGATSQLSGFGGVTNGQSSERTSVHSTDRKSGRHSMNANASAHPHGCWDDKSHLVSIGSDRLMLSVYMHAHDSTTMFFQLTRPDSPSREQPKSQTPQPQRNNSPPRTDRMPRSHTMFERHSNQTSDRSSNDQIGLNVLASTCQAFQTTRIALRNSLSQFNLFVSSSSTAAAAGPVPISGSAAGGDGAAWTVTNGARGVGDFKSLRYPLEVKGVRLLRNKWTHLAFSVIATGKEMSIRITIDGIDQHDVHLPCATAHIKHEHFHVLCVGDSVTKSSPTDANGDSNATNRTSDIADADLAYTLANVQLFHRCITATDILATLVAYGPDASNFVPCAVGNTLPNFGFLNAHRAASDPPANGLQMAQQILRDHLLVFYVASEPAIATVYPIGGTASHRVGRRIAVLGNAMSAQAAQSTTAWATTALRSIASLQTAIVLCGGISTLCYLFARVVELCPSAEPLQASTLAFVLRTIHTSSTLYSEFGRLDGMRLLGPIIRSDRCRRGVQLLGAILDIACDQSVLTRRPAAPDAPAAATAAASASSSSGDSAASYAFTALDDGQQQQLQSRFTVNATTTACVVHADLLVTVIRRYADWHSAQRPNGAVIETLLAVLQALVREKHPRQAANHRRLREAGLVPALLHFCKFYLVGVPSPVPLSVAAAQSLVGLVSAFAGAPPPPALLDDVVKVLLLLHQPSDSFITHDRSKFYFLVSASQPVKQRMRLSLPHLTTGRKFGFIGAIGGGGSGTGSDPVTGGSGSGHGNSVLVSPGRVRKPTTPARHTMRRTPIAESPESLASNRFQTQQQQQHRQQCNRGGRSHVDLTAIADCSRRGDSGKWPPLHEADVVAVQQHHQHHQRHNRTTSVNTINNAGTGNHTNNSTTNSRTQFGSIAASRRRFVRRHVMSSRRQMTRASRCSSTTKLDRSLGSDSESNEVSESGFDENMSGLVGQFDIIAADDVASASNAEERQSHVRAKSATRPKTWPAVSQLPPSSSPATASASQTPSGVRAIQTGLFGMLRDIILILPDNTIRDVLAHFVTVDIVLVLANHRDAAVRAAIVRLMAVICQRLGDASLAQSQRAHSWLHVGNQVALHPVDERLALACCQWVTGAACLSIDQMIGLPDLRVADRVGIHAMLAVLPQTVGDLSLCRPMVQLLDRLYALATPDLRQYAVEHGLVSSLAKCVQQFFLRWAGDESQKEFVTGVLAKIGQTVGSLAIRGGSSINVLWDLLNALHFFEDNRNVWFLHGIRAYQADLLHQLVMSFLPAQRLAKGMSTFKFSLSEITLNSDGPLAATSHLSAAETRTRFEMLIDRTVQFVTTAEPSYQPSEPEMRLVQSIIQLTISGLPRCTSLVTWSLCPARPLALKLFTVERLQGHTQRFPASALAQFTDPKLLRCMLAALLATDYEIMPLAQQQIVQRLANALQLPRPNVVTHLSHTLEKLESMRQSALRDQRPAIERAVHRLEPLVQPCIDAAMRCTRAVVELQNAERRLLINAMRANDDETRLADNWRRLVERMTHEGAPWHSARAYPRSWRIDETEGPARARTRLQRCHLSVAARFRMTPDDDGGGIDASNGDDDRAAAPSADGNTTTPSPPLPPLHYLRESLVQRPHFPLNDQVLYTFACAHLPVDVEHDGEMIVTESLLIFVPNDVGRDPVRLSMTDITEIWPRRHQHRNAGLEFCLANRRTVLFVFADNAAGGADREQLMKFFADKVVHGPNESKLVALTHSWLEGSLTNWEYLIELNQISGRTFQDLMQYPVFPWILADYTSDTLDLNDAASFRRLDRPIAVQQPESEAHYIANYSYLEQAQKDMTRSAAATGSNSSLSGSAIAGIGNTSTNGGSHNTESAAGVGNHMQPYHYGSHYSNSGTVLHYLVRVPPFTSFFLRYQDNNFDLPDRTFHSLHTTWRLASRDSPTDVKELIPEFFTLPEMLENFESFRFGQRQSGERVDNVALPPWSAHSARLFVLIHRQALESDAVRMQLHRWIDLVFGWKQTGAAAVQAINVFHPATYIGFTSANVVDPVEKKAFETMVRTYGQMPSQLFHQPHAAAIVPLMGPRVDPPASVSLRVRGLRWGQYTGSPQMAAPAIVKEFMANGDDSYELIDHEQRPAGLVGVGVSAIRQLVTLPHTNVCYALPVGTNLMQGPEPDTMQVIGWREPDGIVRVRTLTDDDAAAGAPGGGGFHENRNNTTSSPLSAAAAAGRPLVATTAADPITACGSDATATQLWFGHRSGRLVVYRCDAGADTSSTQLRLNKARYVQHSAPFGLASYNSAFRHQRGCSAAATVAGGSSAAAAASWAEPIVLVRHTNQVTAIALSVDFSVCVSVGLDGAAIIWDVHTLAYVRCIEPPSICRPGTPIRLVAISPTLGDIVTVHALDDGGDNVAGDADFTDEDLLAPTVHVDAEYAVVADVGLEATEDGADEVHHKLQQQQQQQQHQRNSGGNGTAASTPAKSQRPGDADDAFESTVSVGGGGGGEGTAVAESEDFVRVVPQNVAGSRSVMRLHTINARYVCHVVDAERIECVTYSSVREGTGINVIAAGYADGTVRLWSSWDLTLVHVLVAAQRIDCGVDTMAMPSVRSVAFSTYQHLSVLTADGVVRVWQSDGLAGPVPKFPRVGGQQRQLQREQQELKRRSV